MLDRHYCINSRITHRSKYETILCHHSTVNTWLDAPSHYPSSRANHSKRAINGSANVQFSVQHVICLVNTWYMGFKPVVVGLLKARIFRNDTCNKAIHVLLMHGLFTLNTCTLVLDHYILRQLLR